MANVLYDKGRESFLKGEILYGSDNIKAALIRTGAGHYVANLATDQFLGVAIASGDIIARTANLGTKTTAAGVAGAANTVFAAVTNGAPYGAVVLFDDTGTDNTSRLIAYIDTAAGLPSTGTGADVNLAWATDANKIFKL
jgi:hypothetical protein